MDKMDKKELEEILAKHAKNTDYKLEIIVDDVAVIKEGMVHLQDDVSVLKKDVSGLKEDVSNLTEKVEVIFEQTGKLTIDMEVIKNSIQRHEQKVKQL